MPVTIKDVARKAGVGVGTVSRVFNRSRLVSAETSSKVLAAAHDLGYYPDSSARRLVRGRTRVIGLIERHSANQPFADAFLALVLRGVHKAAYSAGYHILIEPVYPPLNFDERLTNLVRERHADGIILSGPRFDDALIQTLYAEGVPIVLQGIIPGCDIPSVDADNFNGAKLATQHLIDLGHRRIAHITNGPLIYTAAAARRDGYLAALTSAGITPNPAWIGTGAFYPESGFQAMKVILASGETPTAVFVASDTVAYGAIQAIQQAELAIPRDIAIVGFDDIPWSAYITPPLTTVRLPAVELGNLAAGMLISILNHEPLPDLHKVLPVELVVRQSCGAQLHLSSSPVRSRGVSQRVNHGQ